MKILLLIIFSITVILKTDFKLPICSFETAKQAIPPKLFQNITVDGMQQLPIITRFFHNKVGFFASEMTVCYLNILDPKLALQMTGLIGFIGWLYFVYFSLSKRKVFYILSILVLPLLAFFGLSVFFIALITKAFAIIGLHHFLRK